MLNLLTQKQQASPFATDRLRCAEILAPFTNIYWKNEWQLTTKLCSRYYETCVLYEFQYKRKRCVPVTNKKWISQECCSLNFERYVMWTKALKSWPQGNYENSLNAGQRRM